MIPVRLIVAGPAHSSAWPHNGPRGNTSKFFAVLEFDRKRVSILARWAAYNAPAKLVARVACGIVPALGVAHRSLDTKEPLIVVSDDEEERCGLFVHGKPRAFFQPAAKPGATS